MIEKGKAVRVVRGKKLPVGLVAIVGWVGSTRFGTSVGLKVEGKVVGPKGDVLKEEGEDKLLFTAITNVEPDASPEGLAAEIEAGHALALWIDSKREAEKAAGPVATPKKGDLVMPTSGPYANRWCRVFWAGNGRVGVKPKPGKPGFVGGKPVWPVYAPSWLSASEVTSLPSAA